MKELQFEYKMRLDFDSFVGKHRFTLRCVPHSDGRQQIRDLELSVYPMDSLSQSMDSFGNICIYGHVERRHDHFGFRIRGTAKTGLAISEREKTGNLSGLFRCQTKFTEPGPALRAFADSFSFDASESDYGKAVAYMHGLYRTLKYTPFATNIGTSAEEAMALGKGVCQDYSHILLSLCRMQGIPSRYVVGMLTGEGASHAWVEILSGGYWYALDPTNDLLVDDQHIRLSGGRDYEDCIINQGIFTGNTHQKQWVHVSVKELAG